MQVWGIYLRKDRYSRQKHVWTAAVPDAGRKMERDTQIKRIRETGGREGGRKERERGRERLLPLCSFHRLQISDFPPILYRSEIFRSRSSSPVIDTCAHRRLSEAGSCARLASSLTSPPVCTARQAQKTQELKPVSLLGKFRSSMSRERGKMYLNRNHI